MIEKNDIDPSVFSSERTSFQDSILRILFSLDIANITSRTDIFKIPYIEFVKLGRKSFSDFLNSNQIEKYEAFREECDLINSEIINLAKLIREFYHSKISENSILKEKEFSVSEVIEIMHQLNIRARRLLEIPIPAYTLTSAYNSKSKKKYRMIKAYWIDDNGNRKRIFNKNIGSTEYEMVDTLEKLFISMGYTTFRNQYALENGVPVDIIITKNNIKSVLEIKINKNKSETNLIKTYVSMEMWKLYCSIYLI
jgi:hypothetical protein